MAAPLDAEARDSHHLVLAATDGGRPALRTTAHLFVAGA